MATVRKSGQIVVFNVPTSLDPFINKMVIKRIFFIIKWSSFVVFKPFENRTNLVEPGN
jgi:hypothetical protein